MKFTVPTTVNPSASLADVDPNEPNPCTLAPVVSSCPPWCALGSIASEEHYGGTRATVHRSVVATLDAPTDSFGEHVLARAEIFSLAEEGGQPSTPVLYVEGETQFELTAEQADVFIADAEQFVATLRVLRAQLVEGRRTR